MYGVVWTEEAPRRTSLRELRWYNTLVVRYPSQLPMPHFDAKEASCDQIRDRLHVQVHHLFGVSLDELPTGRHVAAHEHVEGVVG